MRTIAFLTLLTVIFSPDAKALTATDEPATKVADIFDRTFRMWEDHKGQTVVTIEQENAPAAYCLEDDSYCSYDFAKYTHARAVVKRKEAASLENKAGIGTVGSIAASGAMVIGLSQFAAHGGIGWLLGSLALGAVGVAALVMAAIWNAKAQTAASEAHDIETGVS